MDDSTTKAKVPVKKSEEETRRPWALQDWHPIENLRREMERVFDDFDRGLPMSPFRRPTFSLEPFWRRERALPSVPAVNFSETDKAYELTAELPGMDEKDIEVKLANGGLSIKGEKREEKEEREKGYYLHERHFGSFERFFQVPDGVDAEKIEASFKNGVLTVTLPKTPEAVKAEKRIPVKGA